MSVDFVPTDWVNLRPTGGTDLPAFQNVAASTMTAWVIPDVLTATHTIFAFSIGSAGATNLSRAQMLFQGTAFSITGRALDGDSNTQLSTGTASTGTTYFFVARNDFVNKTGYIRAYSLASGLVVNYSATFTNMTAGNTSNTPSRSVAIGSEDNGAGSNFDGKMWDLRAYNRFLSDVECDILFAQRGQDDILEGLVHRFPLDEGAPGTAIGTGANLVKDVVSPVLTQQAAVGGPTWTTPNNLLRRSA